LKPRIHNPAFVTDQDTEISLSGTALVELMTAVLEKGRPFRFLAKGFSMVPFIKDGDVITVAPFLGRKPRIGEAVAFINPKGRNLAVHRIIGKRDSMCILQGDNVPERDGMVPSNMILGYVQRVERQGRTVNLGMGPERRLIAYLNRKGWLFPLRYAAWKLLMPVRERLHRRSRRESSHEEM
jgi:hypothetical protein